jgi:hypothetical protein
MHFLFHWFWVKTLLPYKETTEEVAVGLLSNYSYSMVVHFNENMIFSP